MRINQSINKWQQIVSNFKNLIADKSSKNTTVSTSYKCQLDLGFYVKPLMPVCQPPPSTHVMCQWCSWWCEPFPPSVSHTNTNEKVPQLPPVVEPIFLCHVFWDKMTSWNVLLKLEDLPTYLLTKIMCFFSFYRSNRIVIQKNPVCRDTAWKCEVSTRVTWLWCSNSPIQAHPGHTTPVFRIFWSISALLQRTNHAMLRSPARYTCPNQDVNFPGSNHRILEIPLFFGCP